MKRFPSACTVVLGVVVAVLTALGPGIATAAPIGANSPALNCPPLVDNQGGGDPVLTLQNCDGRLEQFMVGSDTHLYHRYQKTPGGTWSDWTSLGGRLLFDPAGVVNVDGRLEVFGVGADYAMWHIYQTVAGSSPWSSWSSLGGNVVGDPAAGYLAGWRAAVEDTGGDGNPWCDAQTKPGAGPWTGWYPGTSFEGTDGC